MRTRALTANAFQHSLHLCLQLLCEVRPDSDLLDGLQLRIQVIGVCFPISNHAIEQSFRTLISGGTA